MTTVDRLKLLLGKPFDDDLLELYVEMVEQRIINYTNQVTVPPALVLDVLIPMVLEMAESQIETKLEDQKVASVSEGGRTVTFRQEDFVTMRTAVMNERLEFYKDQLNKYRRLL